MRVVIVLSVLAAALIAALFVWASGDDDATALPTQEASIRDIVDVAPRWFRKAVSVKGTAVPVDGEHFVLKGDKASIVVQPEPSAVDGDVEKGEQVRVTGIVTGFDRGDVHELQDLVAGGDHPALAAAPTDLEDPFISAGSVAAR